MCTMHHACSCLFSESYVIRDFSRTLPATYPKDPTAPQKARRTTRRKAQRKAVRKVAEETAIESIIENIEIRASQRRRLLGAWQARRQDRVKGLMMAITMGATTAMGTGMGTTVAMGTWTNGEGTGRETILPPIAAVSIRPIKSEPNSAHVPKHGHARGTGATGD